MARQWTENEINRAIEVIRSQDPALWTRYIQREKSENRVDSDDSRDMTRLIRKHLHPDVEIDEITFLKLGIRNKIRAELNLVWPEGNIAGIGKNT